MTTVVAIDTETTGLIPGHHELWECALIVTGHRDPSRDGEWLFRVKPNLATADPNALRLNRYYQRCGGTTALVLAPLDDCGEKRHGLGRVWTPERVAKEVAILLDGATLVAANPAFDAAFLDAFLRANDAAPSWHYRMLDTGSLAAGRLGVLVGGLADCARAFDIEHEPAELHDALVDARLVARIFEHVMDGAA